MGIQIWVLPNCFRLLPDGHQAKLIAIFEHSGQDIVFECRYDPNFIQLNYMI